MLDAKQKNSDYHLEYGQQTTLKGIKRKKLTK